MVVLMGVLVLVAVGIVGFVVWQSGWMQRRLGSGAAWYAGGDSTGGWVGAEGPHDSYSGGSHFGGGHYGGGDFGGGGDGGGGGG